MSETKINNNNKSEEEIEKNDILREADSHDKPNSLSYNPSVPDDEGEQLEKIKGDAIGDTLYSERFVLSTLLKLRKVEVDFDITNEEGFEADLCAVWDMTVEKDVVDFMLKHDVLEIFGECLEVTQDKRLTELLIGILGNMCMFENSRIQLAGYPKIIATILQLIACSDSLTLIQLMRLLRVVHVYNDPGSVHLVWFEQIRNLPNFATDFAYILQNSINNNLLKDSLETLNAIQANPLSVLFNASDEAIKNNALFINEELIHATIEAFQTLVPLEDHYPEKSFSASPSDASDSTGSSTRKIIQVFLNIQAIFALFKERPCDTKLRHFNQLVPTLSQILEICNAQYLLPPNPVAHDIFENIDDIISGFDDPFIDDLVTHFVKVWSSLHSYVASRLQLKSTNDFEGDIDHIDEKSKEEKFCNCILETILSLIARAVNKANDDLISSTFMKQKPNIILEIIHSLEQKAEKGEQFKKSHQKLLEIYESLNNKKNRCVQEISALIRTEKESPQKIDNNE